MAELSFWASRNRVLVFECTGGRVLLVRDERVHLNGSLIEKTVPFKFCSFEHVALR